MQGSNGPPPPPPPPPTSQGASSSAKKPVSFAEAQRREQAAQARSSPGLRPLKQSALFDTEHAADLAEIDFAQVESVHASDAGSGGVFFLTLAGGKKVSSPRSARSNLSRSTPPHARLRRGLRVA